MREIKFRALGKNGEWVYFDLKTPDSLLPEIDWKTVCEFTGLKDKNGKEIYEGDIVEYISYGKKEKDVVEYKKFGTQYGEIDGIGFGFYYDTSNKNDGHLEVIGNIYEGVSVSVKDFPPEEVAKWYGSSGKS